MSIRVIPVIRGQNSLEVSLECWRHHWPKLIQSEPRTISGAGFGIQRVTLRLLPSPYSLTEICFGLAASVLGKVTVSTPSR